MWVIQLFPPPSQKKKQNKNWCETNLISYQAAKVQTLHNVTNIINKYWGFIIFIKHKFAWIGLFNMSVYKNQKFIAVKMGGNRFYWKPQIYHVYINLNCHFYNFSTKNRNFYETTVAVPENYSYIIFWKLNIFLSPTTHLNRGKFSTHAPIIVYNWSTWFFTPM